MAEDKDEQFVEAITTEDELGSVIRSHIYIEHELSEFIRASCPNSDALKGFEYSEKIRIAIALGLDSKWKPALELIGAIRNRFAHRLDYQITPQDAAAFSKSFTDFAQADIVAGYQDMREISASPFPKDFGANTPRIRVMHCMIYLRAGLIVETDSVSKDRGIHARSKTEGA